MQIIVVDDNAESRYLLESLLKASGYKVVSASNGREALAELEAGRFDLIISDILMPVMDGFQLCLNVKKNEDLRHIPFIIYTATYTGTQDEEFAYKIGADRFLQKPTEPDILMQHIEAVLAEAKSPEKDAPPVPPGEEEVLKLYNERLVRKLEDKMNQLEKEVQARREKEEELRRANSFLDSIVENIPDMVFLKDVRDLRFVRFNRAGEELLGYSRNHMLGKNDFDFFPKEQAQVFTGKDREVIRNKEIVSINRERISTKNKGDRIVRTKKVPILDENGEPEYLLGISEDITEMERSEKERQALTAQLLQAQKLESLGNLAGGIAHDFNNILTAIIGFAEVALIDADKLPANIGDCIKEIYNAGMRAGELVKQILSFARKSDEGIKPIKPKAIITEVVNLLRSSIPTSIEIKKEINGESLVMGSPTQLHQILMNLCTNSVYAMEGKTGVLKIGLHDIAVDEDIITDKMILNAGNYIKLSVSDTGAGIPPKVMDSIFEPYFTTKPATEGTGLGLAVVHGIVKSYGGGIEVISEIDKGTVFHLYFPAVQTGEAPYALKQEDLPRGSEKILFIDDEPVITKLNSEFLTRLGYSVITLNDSSEALELFRDKSDDFDLVITDMTMPGMTGDTLARELMGIREDIPIIICTGYSKAITQESARDMGVKALAHKPLTRADLANTVRKVLDEKKTDQS